MSAPAALTRLPGRRPAAEAARTRARIVRCAERLFAQKGFQGVSMRELARACGVQAFTIQHHFGSKLGLYEEILHRWNREVEELVSEVTRSSDEPGELLDRVVDRLFDFLIAHRDRMALAARAVLGEGLPTSIALDDRGWARFMEDTMRRKRLGGGNLDVRMLLITIEGILNNHVLAVAHYRDLFGGDVTDPQLKARTKSHLKHVLRAVLAL